MPNIQHVTLSTIYNPPNVYCLLSSKLNASSENVESVSIGNPVLTGIILIAYLAIAPRAPPSATNKKTH